MKIGNFFGTPKRQKEKSDRRLKSTNRERRRRDGYFTLCEHLAERRAESA